MGLNHNHYLFKISSLITLMYSDCSVANNTNKGKIETQSWIAWVAQTKDQRTVYVLKGKKYREEFPERHVMLLRCLSVWLHCLLLQQSFWLRILLLPLKWHTVSESIVPGGKRRETKRTIDSNVFLLQEDVTTRTVSATDAAKVLTQHKGNCAEQDITSEICFSGKMSWDFPLFPRILVQSIEWMFIDRTQVSHSLSQSLSQSLSLHIFILRHKERPQDWYETKAKSMKRKKGEVIQAGRSVSFVSLMCEDEGGGGRESTAKTVNVLCSQKTGMKPRKKCANTTYKAYCTHSF